MPSFDELDFHTFSEDIIERAKQILIVLELVEWRWTILDVLEQPEEELRAVMSMKSLGEKMRKQAGRKTTSEGMEQI